MTYPITHTTNPVPYTTYPTPYSTYPVPWAGEVINAKWAFPGDELVYVPAGLVDAHLALSIPKLHTPHYLPHSPHYVPHSLQYLPHSLHYLPYSPHYLPCSLHYLPLYLHYVPHSPHYLPRSLSRWGYLCRVGISRWRAGVCLGRPGWCTSCPVHTWCPRPPYPWWSDPGLAGCSGSWNMIIMVWYWWLFKY